MRAPLEVFYRVERAEVRDAMAVRDGLPVPIPRSAMRAYNVPCFDLVPPAEIRITLEPEAKLDFRVRDLAARQRPPGVEPRGLPWDRKPR